MGEKPEKWLTLKQAKALLDETEVTEQTIRNWGDAGKIVVTRTAGGHRRFSKSSVEKLLAEYRATSTAPSTPDE